jgi:hypothetical protein
VIQEQNMHRSRLRTPTRAVALIALAAAIASSTTSSPAQTASAQLRTLRLVEKGGGVKVVDNPPKAKHQYDFSAGDIVVVTRVIYGRNGPRIGSLRLVCMATSATTQECTGSETLLGGSLEVAGLSTPARATTAAVIGGTGAYSGASGTSVSRDRKTNSEVADQTITLAH